MRTSAPIRRPRRWDDDTIRFELSRLIGDGEFWPTDREFRKAGLTGLETMLRRHKKLKRWMAEFDVSLRSGFDERRLERELRAFTEGMSDFPTRRQFEGGGVYRLLGAARNHGGLEHWAARLGLTFEGPVRGVKKRFYDTPAFIEEMKRFCEGREHLPSQDDLLDAGRGDLVSQVKKHGGYPVVAELIGIPSASEAQGRSDADIERELLEIAGDSGMYPTSRQFEEAGKESLLRCISHNGGGVAWAERLGLKISELQARKRRWSDDDIEAELRALAGDSGRFPAIKDFEAAGQINLYGTICRRGGSGLWARRAGLTPPRRGRRRRGDGQTTPAARTARRG